MTETFTKFQTNYLKSKQSRVSLLDGVIWRSEVDFDNLLPREVIKLTLAMQQEVEMIMDNSCRSSCKYCIKWQ